LAQTQVPLVLIRLLSIDLFVAPLVAFGSCCGLIFLLVSDALLLLLRRPVLNTTSANLNSLLSVSVSACFSSSSSPRVSVTSTTTTEKISERRKRIEDQTRAEREAVS
jgi:hypothetical protein